MTVYAHFSPTPTPLPPAPRRVRGLYRDGCGLWAGRLFIMPHVCVGIFMLGFLVVSIVFALAGSESAGHARGVTRNVSSKGSVSYTVDFVFEQGGKRHEKSHSGLEEDAVRRLGFNPAEATEEGQPRAEGLEVEEVKHPVKVRYLAFGPWMYAKLPEAESAWAMAGFVLVFATFWNGILSIFVWILWIFPLRRYWLVRRGEATVGTVTGRGSSRGSKGGTTYTVMYRYEDPATGRELTGKMQVTSGDFSGAAEGTRVTVIYIPAKPKRSVVYEYCGLTVMA